MRHIENPFGIIGPCGIELMVADLLTIEAEFVATQAADVNHGPLHRLFQREFFAQQGGGIVGIFMKCVEFPQAHAGLGRERKPVPVASRSREFPLFAGVPLHLPDVLRLRRNPLRTTPICTVEKSGGKICRSAPSRDLSLRIPSTHLPPECLVCGQRFTCIRDSDGLARSHLAAIPPIALPPLQRFQIIGHQDLPRTLPRRAVL